jgi:ATP-binding cassette subfamily B protein
MLGMQSSQPHEPVRRATLARVAGCFRPYWMRVVLVALALGGTATLGLLNPLLLRQMLDRALPAQDVKLLGILAVGMVAVTLLAGAIETIETWQTALIGQRVMFDLRVSLFQHLQRMALRFFTENRSGEILSRITSDVTGVQELVTSSARQVLTDAIMTLSTLALMLALDWKLTLICLAMLPLFVWPTRRAATVRKRLAKDAQARVADLSSLMEETLSVSGALLTKTFGRQQREVHRFTAMSRVLYDLELRRAMLEQLFWVTIQTFWAVAPAVIYYVGGRSVIAGGAGALSLGSVVAFVALQNRLFLPLGRLFGVQVQLQGALALFERIFEYLDLEAEVTDRPGAVPLKLTHGELVFDRVSFGYGDAQPALKEVSFTARPGELTALVGPSGAGKTTVTYLVPRLYDVDAGQVRLDGQDVRERTLESVAAAVGVVTQETFLFHASVRENLRYARPDASDEQLYAAARAAQIHEFILQLPQGYDTVVGERGYKLAGGERQRLAIARVILKDAPIVILDEATSALDTGSERLIQAALEPLVRGRTTIAIAHRLSTVLQADQILVFDGGRIVERGTHAELYRRGGLYTRLVDEQYGAAAIPLDEPAPPLPRPEDVH